MYNKKTNFLWNKCAVT